MLLGETEKKQCPCGKVFGRRYLAHGYWTRLSLVLWEKKKHCSVDCFVRYRRKAFGINGRKDYTCDVCNKKIHGNRKAYRRHKMEDHAI